MKIFFPRVSRLVFAVSGGLCLWSLCHVSLLWATENAVPAAASTASALADPASAPAVTESRELWTGSLYSSSYRAGVCRASDGTVRGVLLLRVPSGKVDVYHFQGAHTETGVTARHSSGHSFEGQFDSADEVSGTITLKSGFTVRLKGQRTHGVELSSTCRPLPE